MGKLKEDDIIKMLELYKKYECLWKTTHKHFKLNCKRIEAYSRIKDAMNLRSISEVKKNINAFRETYASEKAKMKGPSLTGGYPDGVYKTKLRWYNLADSFLSDIDGKDESQMMPDQIKNRSIFINHNADGSEYCSRVVRSETHPPHRRLTGHPTHVIKKMVSKQCQTKFDTDMKADEFYYFGMNVAMQLKTLPLVRALHLQTRFQQILCDERIASVQESYRNERSTSVSSESMDYCPFVCEGSVLRPSSPVEIKLEPQIEEVTNWIPSEEFQMS